MRNMPDASTGVTLKCCILVNNIFIHNSKISNRGKIQTSQKPHFPFIPIRHGEREKSSSSSI